MKTISRPTHGKILIGAVLAALAATACGPKLPPKELVDARAQYEQSAKGLAAIETPAQLHTAKTALDKAEAAYSEDGNEPHVRDKAYVALRKAQLAEASARVQLAEKTRMNANLEAQRLQAQMLERTQSDLQSSQRNLSKTQEELEAERKARAEAERKHAQAMSDLKKIASVKQETRGMVITLSGQVLFASNESSLLPAAVLKLNDVATALLRGNRDANITIEGHTDSQGSRDYNMQLAQKRAESVKEQLVARGVAPDRIQAVGVGPDRPIADNRSAEGRANNRRVEIIVEGTPGSEGPQPAGAGMTGDGTSGNGAKGTKGADTEPRD